METTLRIAKAFFNNAPDLAAAIRKMVEENESYKKQMEEIIKEKTVTLKNSLKGMAKEINGINLVTIDYSIDPAMLKNAAFMLQKEAHNLVIAAAVEAAGKPQLLLMYSEDLVKAGHNAGADIREAAKLVMGGGGGQPGLATGYTLVRYIQTEPMKKLDQFILKSFVGPFIAILLVVVFILMMQFLWLYIDELVGKGLSLKVILEFLGWGSITMLPLSLPLATLLSSMMTLGTLGENNELLAIKAAGISLQRVLIPLGLACGAISIGAYFVSNDLMPVAYNKIYQLREDIGKTKDEIKIPTKTFYNGIDGYILRVDERNDDTGIMHGVMVYNHTKNKGNTSLTLADSAMMMMSKDKTYLSFILFDGANYEETNNKKYRDTTLQLQKIDFHRQELIIPLENYAFQKSDTSRFKDQVKSMNLEQLQYSQDSIGRLNAEGKQNNLVSMRNSRTLRYNKQLDTAAALKTRTPLVRKDIGKWKDLDDEIEATEKALRNADELQMALNSYSRERYYHTFTLRLIDIEIFKKFALSIACFIFFFIGAPLGAIIRKGRLGVSAIISVLFFVAYYVIDIAGTKLARDGAVGAFIGVFFSSFVLFPTGLFLTWKAINDASLLNIDSIKNGFRKLKATIMGFFKKTRIVYMGTPEFAVDITLWEW